MKPDYQLAIYDALLEAGEDLGLRHFGGRALNSLRLEKGFGSFTREYTPDYTPFQAGLERFVDMRKNDFIGREALIEEQRAGPARKRVIFKVDANGVDALANEPVLCDGGDGRLGDLRRLLPSPRREHRARLRAERGSPSVPAGSRSRSSARCAMPSSCPSRRSIPQAPGCAVDRIRRALRMHSR